MRLECKPCKHWHTLSPTGMFIVIHSLISGDLQKVTGHGIESRCIGDAFTSPSMEELRPVLKGKLSITLDGHTWDMKEGRFV